MAKKTMDVRVGDLTWTQDAWDKMLASADRAAEDYARNWPRVKVVRYDRKSKLVVLELSNSAQLAIPADKLQGVATASEAARSDVRILGPNWAIEFPKIDEQFTVESLLTGVFGNRQWMIGLSKPVRRAKSSRRQSAIRANAHNWLSGNITPIFYRPGRIRRRRITDSWERLCSSARRRTPSE